jgi:hypothetical protein
MNVLPDEQWAVLKPVMPHLLVERTAKVTLGALGGANKTTAGNNRVINLR